jgi:hypothetical protein
MTFFWDRRSIHNLLTHRTILNSFFSFLAIALILRFWIQGPVREMKLFGHLSRFIRSIDEYILVTKIIT